MSAVCCYGEPHQRLMRYLVQKHRESYDRHIVDVLVRKEQEISQILRTNLASERQIQTELVPELTRRREELAALNQKLQRVEEERVSRSERDRLAARVGELEWVTEAVTGSISWKITAPLRATYDALGRLLKRTR